MVFGQISRGQNSGNPFAVNRFSPTTEKPFSAYKANLADAEIIRMNSMASGSPFAQTPVPHAPGERSWPFLLPEQRLKRAEHALMHEEEDRQDESSVEAEVRRLIGKPYGRDPLKNHDYEQYQTMLKNSIDVLKDTIEFSKRASLPTTRFEQQQQAMEARLTSSERHLNQHC